MGINRESLNFILDTTSNYGIKPGNCRMVELGNQVLKGIGGTAKQYFQSINVDHVSIDINGKDGALNLDLQQRIKDPLLVGTFDVLTDFGTVEHVKSQYTCWLNIHNLVKQNGLFIHLLPRTGHWAGHGDHKYSLEFFENLSHHCKYQLLENFIRVGDPKKDFVCCAMIKRRDNEFIPNIVFKTLGISKR